MRRIGWADVQWISYTDHFFSGLEVYDDGFLSLLSAAAFPPS